MKELGLEEIKKIQIDILKYLDSVCRENDIHYSLADGTLLGAVRHKGYIPWDDDIDIVLLRDEYNRLLDILYSNNDPLYKVISMRDKGYWYAYAKLIDIRTYIIEKNWPNDDRIGVNIDIFPIDYVPDDEEGRNKVYKKSMYCVDGLKKCLTDISFKHSNPLMRLSKRIARHKDVAYCRKMGEKYWKDELEKIHSSLNKTNTISYTIQTYNVPMSKEYFGDYIDLEFEGEHFMSVKEYDGVLKTWFGDYMQLPPIEKRISNHDFTAYWR